MSAEKVATQLPAEKDAPCIQLSDAINSAVFALGTAVGLAKRIMLKRNKHTRGRGLDTRQCQSKLRLKAIQDPQVRLKDSRLLMGGMTMSHQPVPVKPGSYETGS